MVFLLGFQFYSIDQYLCLYTSTMQFLSLLFCSKAWGPPAILLLSCIVLAILVLYLVLFLFFDFPGEFENCSFYVFEKLHLNFNGGLNWICRFPLVEWPFLLCYFYQPWAWAISPFSEIFDIFLERLEVVVVQILHLFG